jgi:hypothetical protein
VGPAVRTEKRAHQFRRENDHPATVIQTLTTPEAERLALAAEYQGRPEIAFVFKNKRALR